MGGEGDEGVARAVELRYVQSLLLEPYCGAMPAESAKSHAKSPAVWKPSAAWNNCSICSRFAASCQARSNAPITSRSASEQSPPNAAPTVASNAVKL